MSTIVDPGSDAPVALLLTDLVDSAAITAALGDSAMAELWTEHDHLARELLRAWRGREIDKTDGFLLLFAEPRDALGYVLAYHRMLPTLEQRMRQRHGLAQPLRARAGLHVGVLQMRTTPAEHVARGAKPVEVDGVDKPLAARVMSTALGGQTLITSAAREALGAVPQRLVSHGFWRVKGLPAPLELHEVGDEDAPFEPPPDADKVYRVVRQGEVWLPLRETRHTLPAERDGFVGRRPVLHDIARRYEGGARLVSLLGIGGCGKTRLAQRFGWAWLGDFPGGAWFCDLSSASTPEGLVNAVARGLDVPLGADDPVQQLGHAIAGRGACLLVLDNFEQLARHADATLGRWLEWAPQARFLVTSREVLGIAGEEVVAVAPLPTAEAEALFRRRAAAARSGFVPDAEDEAAIAPLVRLLDGLPLAIELAAARVRSMSPKALLARMSERFRLLAGGSHRVDRQATLRAAFDWSWDLLNEAERQALAQLSVFEGGFPLVAAEAVLDVAAAAGAGEPEPWTVDLVQSLVDKSFVRALEGAGGERFDLLGTVQEYAQQHLAGLGRLAGGGAEALAATRRRHARWAAALRPAAGAPPPMAELDNLAAACRNAAALSEPEPAAAALEGAWSVLALRGPFAAGVALADAVLAMPAPTAGVPARAHLVRGQALLAAARRREAEPAFAAALAAAGGDGAAMGHAAAALVATSARIGLAACWSRQGRIADAESALAEALAWAERSGDAERACAAGNGLGALHFEHGRPAEARGPWEQALVRARSAGLRRWQALLLGNLGTLHSSLGQTKPALALGEQALAIARALGDRKAEGNTLANLGMLHLVREDAAAAVLALDAALQLARDLGHPRLETVARCNLGLAEEARGAMRPALSHFEEALALAERSGDLRSQGQALGYLGRVAAGLGAIGTAREALARGRTLLEGQGDPLSLALLLACAAEAERCGGDPQAARDAYARSRALAAECDAGPLSELGQALARLDLTIGNAASGSVSR
jgi:predicted ATPase/class 3 adenylate cyclase